MILLQVILPEQLEDDNVQIEFPTQIIAQVIGFYKSEEGFPCWSLNPKGLHFTTSADDFVYIGLTVSNKTREFVLMVGYGEEGDIYDIPLRVTSVKEVQDFPSISSKM